MFHRLITIALCAGALLSSAPAQAQELPTNRPATTVRTAVSLDIARQFFNHTASCRVRVYYAPAALVGALAPGAVAAAAPCTGPPEIAGRIFLSDGLAGNNVVIRVITCTIIVHEYGHVVFGPAHSNDPTSIMYHAVGPIVYLCYKRFIRTRSQRQAWRNSYPVTPWARP